MEITLPFNYKEYKWEIPIVKAFHAGKTLWLNLHRRAGKDLFCFCRLLLPAAIKRPGTYHYIWPTLKQGRDSFWEGKDEEGRDIRRYYIPQELIVHEDNQDMKLTISAAGGGTSTLQIFGTNMGQFEALRGKPGNGAVFSEYAYQDPRGLEVVSPMLKKTGGWAAFASTPNGNNHFKSGYNAAEENPKCFTLTMTVDDTYDHFGERLLTSEDIEEERKNGRSEDFIQQEYYCSFNQGIEGTYLGRQLTIVKEENRIGDFSYDENSSVMTAWDLGVADFMSIIFFQLIGNNVRVIDYYENSGFSFVHYAKVLVDKGYFYNGHIAPHDVMAREMGGKEEKAMSRLEKAEEVGIKFLVLPKATFETGVENARSVMGRCYFNRERTKTLINHLEQWGRVFNQVSLTYSDAEKHDVHSHAGAAFRYMATSVIERTFRSYDYPNINAEAYFEEIARHSSGFAGL